MSGEKFPPGPWTAALCVLNPVNPMTIVAANGVAVASIEVCHYASGDTYEAREGEINATRALIAAAPAMLAALREYKRLRDQYRPDPAPHEWMRCEERIDAAIHAATGGAS